MEEQPSDREILHDEPASEDELVPGEEEAAAAEAGRIGGAQPQPDADPADRPLAEAGGGEAEGFEESEAALERQASHEDPGSSPTQDAFEPEEESDRSTAVYGEADEVDPTEVTGDPREDE